MPGSQMATSTIQRNWKNEYDNGWEGDVSGSSSRDGEGGHHALVLPWFPVNSYLRCTVLSLH